MTPAAVTTQRREAMHAANAKKMQIACLRRALRTGELAICDVLRNPPECVHHLLFVELLLRIVPRFGRRSVEALGRHALYDGVNLNVRIGRSSQRTREWLACHVDTWPGGTKGSR